MADLDDPKRLAAFTASILDLDEDGVLQECVEHAAKRADAPIALVSFVMRRVQFFRAAIGLPPELDASRATSRCDSFCQFVVKDEAPFVVTDAKNDARVPQKLVQTYGIMAYLGVPIRAGGQTLGSLCVADGKERAWNPELVDQLNELAATVSARLDELTRVSTKTLPPPAAPGPLAAGVVELSEVIQRSLVEVAPFMRLAKGVRDGLPAEAAARGASVLSEAIDFYDDMCTAVDQLCVTAWRLRRALSHPHAN